MKTQNLMLVTIILKIFQKKIKNNLNLTMLISIKKTKIIMEIWIFVKILMQSDEIDYL